jgi:hypothetical protein
MHVHRVAPHPEGLTSMGDLDVAQPHENITAHIGRMRDDVNSKLVTSGFGSGASLEAGLRSKLAWEDENEKIKY